MLVFKNYFTPSVTFFRKLHFRLRWLNVLKRESSFLVVFTLFATGRRVELHLPKVLRRVPHRGISALFLISLFISIWNFEKPSFIARLILWVLKLNFIQVFLFFFLNFVILIDVLHEFHFHYLRRDWHLHIWFRRICKDWFLLWLWKFSILIFVPIFWGWGLLLREFTKRFWHFKQIL